MNHSPNTRETPVKIRFEADIDFRIMMVFYVGIVTLKELIKSWEKAIEKQIIPDNLFGFVFDFQYGIFDLNHDEHLLIADFFNSHPEVFERKRLAYITLRPRDVTIPILIDEHAVNYEVRPFSTRSAAIGWILEGKKPGIG